MSTWFASATLWDWAIGLVAVLSILMGLWRGFVRTAFGLAAWVLAFLFTAPVSALVAPWVASFSMPTLVLQVIVFLVLFVLCRFVGAMVSRAMRAIGLGGLDRFFGALLGAARPSGPLLAGRACPAAAGRHGRGRFQILGAVPAPAVSPRPTLGHRFA